MIEGLDKVLGGSAQPGLAELRDLLQELLGGSQAAGRFIAQEALQRRAERVFRLQFEVKGQPRSVVIKRLRPNIARRNELVAQRWLPAIGLNECGPPLMGSAAARSGACVWHVYEDLGQGELDPKVPDHKRVQAAVELIAQMHKRFAGHPLLGEVRLHGGDLGIHFYEANVRDAIYALQALKPAAPHAALRDRLLDRLQKLRRELQRRSDEAAELGGPETLLHGDLWAINVFVIPTGSGMRARLIDWDHAAAGPASYDLSTFLLRFPAPHRPWILELYRQALERAGGWRLPGESELNLVFETHEYSRFANRIIWPAIALVMDQADWVFEELAEVERWFDQFEPVLPVVADLAV